MAKKTATKDDNKLIQEMGEVSESILRITNEDFPKRYKEMISKLTVPGRVVLDFAHDSETNKDKRFETDDEFELYIITIAIAIGYLLKEDEVNQHTLLNRIKSWLNLH